MSTQVEKTSTSSSPSHRKMRGDKLIMNLIGYMLLTIISLFCLFPFVLILSSSFASEQSIVENGFQILPTSFSTEAYRILFEYPAQMLNAYAITIIVTVLGTVFGLLLTSMTAYVLARKDFKWRNKFSFLFFFTTLFSGGLVPWYLLIVNYLNLKDTLLVLILPMLLNVFYIIVMKSFMGGIPEAITESAKIDGAGDFLIYFRLIIPLSKPALATIGLFIALGYWNDWYYSLLFISDERLMPLQYYLYNMLGNMEGMRQAMISSGAVVSVQIPSESLKMAMTIVATGPILFAYPFIQRYFVQGLTLGAVKG